MNGTLPILTHLKRLIVIGVAVVLLLPAAVRAEASPEYKLKAAYLFNFARFAKWPANSFAETNSPLVIGVLGDNPFDNELERLVSGRQIGGRTVVFKHMLTVADAKACQIVFISASEQARLRQHLDILRSAAVLTIGESPELIEAGGIIRFFIEEKKIRFEINQAQAEAEGVQLDSQLLSLAATVRAAAGRKGG